MPLGAPHPQVVFQPELGLDPVVDVLMVSGDLRASIQVRTRISLA